MLSGLIAVVLSLMLGPLAFFGVRLYLFADQVAKLDVHFGLGGC